MRETDSYFFLRNIFYNGGDIMVLNPIKRFKLQKKLKQNRARIEFLETWIDKFERQFKEAKTIEDKEIILEVETKFVEMYEKLVNEDSQILFDLYNYRG